ncbi:hypothetical protein [Aerophototrophica crusticola]
MTGEAGMDGNGGDMEALEPQLSEAELKRLERFKNRRGRRKPSVMPTDLARTSAFAPRRRNLNTDANFSRVYSLTYHSVVEVKGRELGSQHRDVIYALFRMRAVERRVPNPNHNPNIRTIGVAEKPYLTLFQVETTWRDLLRIMNRTEHVNNLGTVLESLEQIRSVSIRVYQGGPDAFEKALATGRIPKGRGFSDSLLGKISWDGPKLDDRVIVEYGEWVRRVFELRHLVSLNADVYFALKSDYAKTFWPYIDSQPGHTWIDEEMLGELSGRKIKEEAPTKRRAFKQDCRQAFDDMVRAGGLKRWWVEEQRRGRFVSLRFHYEHALPRQGELALAAAE